MEKGLLCISHLKRVCHEIFDFRFLMFRIFLKFAEIFPAHGAPPGSLTSVANRKKCSIRKVVIILFGHLWVVDLTYCIDKYFLSSSL
jgi:hypothetical protein